MIYSSFLTSEFRRIVKPSCRPALHHPPDGVQPKREPHPPNNRQPKEDGLSPGTCAYHPSKTPLPPPNNLENGSSLQGGEETTPSWHDAFETRTLYTLRLVQNSLHRTFVVNNKRSRDYRDCVPP